jgi:putative transcription factor
MLYNLALSFKDMHCEICGKEIRWGYLVEIEGAKLIACPSCAERGRIIRKVYDREMVPRRTRKESKEDAEEGAEKVLVRDYGKRIREAREAKGITREELAKKLHIKEGYLHKIEEGELTPTDDVAKKLEKTLGIQLYEEVKEDTAELPVEPEEEPKITLGDVVKIRWVKK